MTADATRSVNYISGDVVAELREAALQVEQDVERRRREVRHGRPRERRRVVPVHRICKAKSKCASIY